MLIWRNHRFPFCCAKTDMLLILLTLQIPTSSLPSSKRNRRKREGEKPREEEKKVVKNKLLMPFHALSCKCVWHSLSGREKLEGGDCGRREGKMVMLYKCSSIFLFTLIQIPTCHITNHFREFAGGACYLDTCFSSVGYCSPSLDGKKTALM